MKKKICSNTKGDFMKTVFALFTALFIVSAFAAGDDHMIESNVDSLVRGAYNWNKTKSRGKGADNNTELDLTLNYAYKFRPHWQLGTRLNYLKDQITSTENYGFQVGGFWNHDTDFANSMYVSFFTGLNWDHSYNLSSANGRNDEKWASTLAVGKRFSLCLL